MFLDGWKSEDDVRYLYDPDKREEVQYEMLREGIRQLLAQRGVLSESEVSDTWIVDKLRHQLGLSAARALESSQEPLKVLQSHLVQVLQEAGVDTSRVAINTAEALTFDTVEQRRILALYADRLLPR